MITKFKIYEDITTELKINDYIIANEDSGARDVDDFTANNIGQIYDFDGPKIYVKYRKVPPEIKGNFDLFSDKFRVGYPIKYSRYFYFNEIEYCSKLKRDCELYLKTKKFNI